MLMRTDCRAEPETMKGDWLTSVLRARTSIDSFLKFPHSSKAFPRSPNIESAQLLVRS
jgi:hypothetical protein